MNTAAHMCARSNFGEGKDPVPTYWTQPKKKSCAGIPRGVYNVELVSAKTEIPDYSDAVNSPEGFLCGFPSLWKCHYILQSSVGS
jgi:hypothetical protein